MKTKICSRCNDEKAQTEYCKSSRMKDGLQSACKPCMNDSYTRSRKKKQTHYRQVQTEREQRYVQRFNEWKATQKCLKCGDADSACLDFHHLDPSTKDGDISNLVKGRVWETLQKELQKCVVLCASCHRKYHAGRFELVGIQ